MPGLPERSTHDYFWHTTTILFAAFNIEDGTVISSAHRRNRALETKKFLQKIDAEVSLSSSRTTPPTRHRK